MAKEANKQDKNKQAAKPVAKQPSAGRGFLDTLMLLVAAVALVGAVFCFYYFQTQWQPLQRFGLLAGSVVLSIVLIALTGFGRSAWQYIRGARVEAKKITWTTRPELLQTTLAVFVVVIITAILLSAFDAGVSGLFDLLVY